MKILIGLIEHFGDIVACEPVARYLREKYPDAHITWAVRQPFRELIDVNPHVDETVLVECLTDWIKLYKHGSHDLLVDLHVNYRVCQECRVPLIKEHGNPFVNAYEWFDYGGLLEAFSQGAGLPRLSAQPRVYLQDEHWEAVNSLNLPADYCVIHRESNSTIKDWRDRNWRLVADYIGKELNLPVVEVGSKRLSPHATETSQSGESEALSPLGCSVISLLNRTSLLETAEVIRRARFFVGIDSGPAHLANAVRTPGVLLLGQHGIFRQYTPFTGFYASKVPEVRIVRNLVGLVAEIAVEDVIDAVRRLCHVLSHKTVQTMTHAAAASGGTASRDENSYRQMITESGLFDRAWYVTHYPEALQNGLDPLDHFIHVGEEAGHSPGLGFDPVWYKTQRPDIAQIKDPMRHYLHFGGKEGLRPCPYPKSSVNEAALDCHQMGVSVDDIVIQPHSYEFTPDQQQSMPRLFAFYLPQFHPIPENNYGHRSGFTEWDNVIKSKPLFKGHYQPRVPGELGYYDLRSIDVMREQVKLATDHGISGFCFYYYYFQGKKLLYKPVENYLNSDIQAPFFFLWANENWSRRWDGGDNEVIVSQHHSEEDNLMFIRDLMPVLLDNRYVKVDGKPILAIYKTHLFPNIQKATDLWREEVVKHGLPGLYLVMVDDWGGDPPHPRELGFDASYEIPSNIVPEQVLLQEQPPFGLEDGFEGRIVDYQKFASFHMGRPFPHYKRLRTVMAPWDNTPRYGKRAMVHVNSDNDAYKLWLSQAMLDTTRRYAPEERIVFLHSWNEWCEGTYLEPDGKYGRRLLEQTREVVEEFRDVLASESKDADSKVGRYYRRLLKLKTEASSRSLIAMRQQNMYIYRDLEYNRAQVTALSHQIRSLTASVEEQVDTNTHLQALVKKGNSSTEELTQQIEMKAQLRDLTEQLQSLTRSIEEQASTRVAQIEQLASQLSEQGKASEPAQSVQQVLEGIYQSKSWRLTKPLRDVAGLLKNSNS